jgi:hypothetical protein
VTTDGPPLAFSGSRLAWSDLPRDVRSRIADRAGAGLISETVTTSGFSPGYASLLELGDGTEIFVKAVSPEQNPTSPDLARAEAAAVRLLPEAVPAPRLLWSDDDGTWVILGFEAVPGRAPTHPWHAAELDRVLAAVAQLAEVGTPAPAALPPLAPAMAGFAASWGRLADEGDPELALTAAGPHGEWLRSRLPDVAAWAALAPEATAGDTLAHNDLRADNVLLDATRVWLVDWPHATAGAAPWVDLLEMIPSVAMQDGGDPEDLFWSHPVSRGTEREAARSALAAVTGYLLHAAVQPPPPGIANLRQFQHAQALSSLAWLRRF